MIKSRQKLLKFINIITDVLFGFLSYFLAIYIRVPFKGGEGQQDFLSGYYILYAFLIAVVISFGYYISGIYDRLRFNKYKNEFLKILIINAIACVLWMTFLYITRSQVFSRWTVLIYYVVCSLIAIIKRLVIRVIMLSGTNIEGPKKHIVIVGSGELAVQFKEDCEKHPELGIQIDGYFGNTNKDLGKSLGAIWQLSEKLENTEIDSLVIALEAPEMIYMNLALSVANKEGLRVELIPFYNSYMPSHPIIENIGRSKLIDLRATPLDNFAWAFIKRAIDIVGSFLLIIVTSPLMIFAAIGVKLSSPGPIFFVQPRVGKDKKVFGMLKFRSMRTDIDHTGWSTQDDPRKTKFGSFIRKYSIDELPQFFNVFIGQMSLVGPRPEIPKFVNEFKESVPRYLVRQQVRPGITGWAQVNGLRGDTSIDARVEYDIWYIENWSLGLDIRILWDTVFGGKFKNDEVVKK